MTSPNDDLLALVPIEPHLDSLANSDRLDRLAIAICTIRPEESGPPIRAILDRAADGEFLTEPEAMLLFRGLHILGAVRDQKAFAPLLRLLRRSDEDLYYLLGDAVTATLPRIAAGVFDGDAEALFAAVSDSRIAEFARGSLLSAATFLTWDGRIDRDRMVGFLRRFHEDRLADDDDYVWVAWLEAIALLGLRDLAPLVREAWREGRLPEGVLEPADFENDLAAAERDPSDIARFHANHLGYIEDVVEALEWSDHPRSATYQGEPWASERFEPIAPASNPWRDVGRNDPCPCGSGKKAKKCCMAS